MHNKWSRIVAILGGYVGATVKRYLSHWFLPIKCNLSASTFVWSCVHINDVCDFFCSLLHCCVFGNFKFINCLYVVQYVPGVDHYIFSFFSEGLQLFLYGEMLVLLIKLTSCLACYFLIAFIIRICASSFMYYWIVVCLHVLCNMYFVLTVTFTVFS